MVPASLSPDAADERRPDVEVEVEVFRGRLEELVLVAAPLLRPVLQLGDRRHRLVLERRRLKESGILAINWNKSATYLATRN